jgi:hypothetical protein
LVIDRSFFIVDDIEAQSGRQGLGGFVRRRTTATLRLAHIPRIEKHAMKCVALQAQV